jgi:hypothetical protein
MGIRNRINPPKSRSVQNRVRKSSSEFQRTPPLTRPWGRKVPRNTDDGATRSRSRVSKRPTIGAKLGGSVRQGKKSRNSVCLYPSRQKRVWRVGKSNLSSTLASLSSCLSACEEREGCISLAFGGEIEPASSLRERDEIGNGIRRGSHDYLIPRSHSSPTFSHVIPKA